LYIPAATKKVFPRRSLSFLLKTNIKARFGRFVQSRAKSIVSKAEVHWMTFPGCS